MIRIIVDTNFLLQYRPAANLPWGSLLGPGDVTLILVRTVLAELDRHKFSDRKRLRTRARHWSSLLSADDEVVVLKEAAPRIELVVSEVTGRKAERPGLDLNYPDHQILLQALDYAEAHPADRVLILSGDTLLRRQARQRALESLAPPDEWELEPEPDEKESENRRLKEDLAELRNAQPKVEIELGPEHGKEAEIDMVWYPPLEEETIAELLLTARDMYPIARIGVQETRGLNPSVAQLWKQMAHLTGGGYDFNAPSDDQILKYTEVDYPFWLDRVREALKDFHRHAMAETRYVDLVCTLTNPGGQPATEVAVTVRAEGDLRLLKKGRKPEGPLLPPPPAAPRRVDFLASLRDPPPRHIISDLSRMKLNQASDSFGWADDYSEKPVLEMIRTNRLWRHRSTPEIFGVRIVGKRPGDPQEVLSGVFTLTVEASNLVKPVRKILPIRIHITEGDTKEAAEIALRNASSPNEADE